MACMFLEKYSSFYSLKLMLLVSAALFATACEKKEVEQSTLAVVQAGNTEPGLLIPAEQADILGAALWQQGLQAMEGGLEEAEKLELAIVELLESPSEKSLSIAKSQWRDTFLQYQRFAPFLQVQKQGATQALAQPLKQLKEWQFTLSAWPIQPGYLDSYDVYLHSGIVHDISLPITKSILRKQHGLTDSEEVTLGLHAIEFMLWANKEKTAFKRFVKKTKVPLVLAQSGLKQNELPNNRRRQLIKLQSQLLTSDMQTLIKQWRPNGIFSMAFNQFDAPEKIFSVHAALQSSIQQLRELLLYHDSKGDDDGLNINRFAGERNQALMEALTTVEALYFSETISLANALFPAEKQQQLKALLNEVKSQIANQKESSYELATNTLSEMIALLATNAEQNG
jgi:hypothetical protein